jgi:DNA-binding protein YbaB
MLGGFDTQIQSAQIVFAEMLQQLTELAFRMDEKYWPDRTKTIRGVSEGAPYEATYVPSQAIAGDYTCDVTYGFMAGLDANRALVFLLQLRGDQSIDRDTLQRNLPFDVDINQLQEKIEIEKLRDAAHEGIAAYVQSIGPLAAQGQDATKPLRIVAKAIQGVQKGQSIEDLLVAAFEEEDAKAQAAAQQAQEAQAQAGGAPGAPGGPGGPGAGPGGLPPGGLPPGVAPGQQGMPPGGRPSLQTLMASLGATGKPTLTAGVRRQIPTG